MLRPLVAHIAWRLRGVIAVIATEFGAPSPLDVRTDTVCIAGEKGWPHNDDEKFRSTCWVQVTTAYAVDNPPLPALGRLEAPLAAISWHIGGLVANAAWNLTGGRGGFTYFVGTEGANWQDAWNQQRSSHPYVVVVTGFLEFAEQRW